MLALTDCFLIDGTGGNPLEQISNTRNIIMVVKDGEVLINRLDKYRLD